MEDFKSIIEILVNSQTVAALLGFLGGILAQFFLRKQISTFELKQFRLAHKKQSLEKLKSIGEEQIRQMMAYDELANHILLTIEYGLYDKSRLDGLVTKLKSLKEEISPRLQIYFHEMANLQNEYSQAIMAFDSSFFSGLKYEGLNMKGYSVDDIKRINEEYVSVQKTKQALVVALIDFLNKKEEEILK